MLEGTEVSFAEAILAATIAEFERDGAFFAFGEGINDPGGFFGSTVGLLQQFGLRRSIDVPNSEETLVGFGLGAALGGLRPLFVNLRIEFLLLAMNQLVNHVAKWGPMQGRDIPVPFTIRALIGRGWGQGAQHSGSYAAMLAHVPGLQVAIASGPRQGAELLVAALRGDRPTIVIEPKAVYGVREPVGIPSGLSPGHALLKRQGTDFTLLAVGDAVQLGTTVANELAAIHGLSVEVIDVCWLAPIDGEAIRRSANKTGRVGVLDIGWESFGLAAEVARILLRCSPVPLAGPLLSWAPAGHAPAGCFAESRHYPTAEQVAAGILTAVGCEVLAE